MVQVVLKILGYLLILQTQLLRLNTALTMEIRRIIIVWESTDGIF